MREIKFRAYSKVHGTIFDVRNIFFYHDEGKSGLNAVELLDENENTQLVAASDVELLQYAGLKDSNEKDIFEGDIVKKSFGYFESITGEVKFYDGGWFIDNKSDSHFLWDEILDVEILGNIYENPELLEV